MSETLRLLKFAERFPQEPLALATVVRTRGSTYRRPGARMLITAQGERCGAVSGGCLERDVAAHGEAVLRDGVPRLLAYDTRLTLGCHGLVEILVERVPGPGGALLEAWSQKLAGRAVAVVATAFEGGPRGSFLYGTPEFPMAWNAAAEMSIASGQAGRIDDATGAGSVLLSFLPPPPRLVIFGTGYDVVPLTRLAAELGWEVVVVAHPMAPAVEGELAASPAVRCWNPELAAQELRPDPWTAVVIMTHHFGRDLAFLQALLPLPLPYLGLLGPRRRRDQLLAALADAGADGLAEGFTSLRSPVGLDLGGEGPEEIALSIIAEVQAVLSGRAGAALRARRGAIHEPAREPAHREIA